MIRIYLAGPDVFLPDPVQRGVELKRLCAACGADGLYPLDNEIADAADRARAIRDANMAMIRSCDALVANMAPFRGPSMDPGTAYEMGAASALAKLVVGYSADRRCYVERVCAAMQVHRSADGALRDADAMAVEEFELPLVDNLMMAHGVEAMFTTAAEAIAYAAGLAQRSRQHVQLRLDDGAGERLA